MGNSFFNDFDPQRVEHNVEAEHIRGLLSEVETLRRSERTGGMTEDDVVDLLDYFMLRFGKSMEPLAADFWPTATELAPYLANDARRKAVLRAVGEIDLLTDAYRKLSTGLSGVGNPTTVYAPVEALVKPLGDGGYTQADSIMNVDILERLGRTTATRSR